MVLVFKSMEVLSDVVADVTPHKPHMHMHARAVYWDELITLSSFEVRSLTRFGCGLGNVLHLT
jgi:hypothetical protein